MKKLEPIKDERHLRRDPHSMAVVNIDRSGLEAYKKRKKQTNKINELENDFNSLKEEIIEIKELLKSVLEARVV